MHDALSGTPRRRFAIGPMAMLIAGNAALALGPWLVRIADTGPVAAGFWRLALAFPVILVLALREERAGFAHIGRAGIALMVLAGLFFAADLASWHIGIERTRMGNAALFGNSGSVILMVWGLFVAWRRPHHFELLAITAAIGGALILLDGSLAISRQNLIGDLFSLAAGIFYAGYLLALRSVRPHLGPWQLLAVTGITGAPVLLVIALMLGERILPHEWSALFLLALSSQMVGQGLLIRALGWFSPLVIGVSLLTEPAVAALIGHVFFDEVLSAMDMLGMAMVASALVLARLSETAPGRKRI
ncbi:membrane protein [Croceicoccus mobilis]|uniref:Membrane protein n=1 Tax=Croceicoccus mobilis TaxID=1703339 RepID=A0A917DRB5_9SPHN|nr:membrane protein [Croceicoccus mobilis]